ncbi:MAG: helix-turn-helix domain-containing protein [Thermoanaerobaculia bacterium]
METFGERLRRLRAEKGLSLDELASRTGISKAYLWKLEKKPDANPSVEVAQRIAAALETTVADLLSSETEKGQVPIEIPEGLREAQGRFAMSDQDVAELASIRFRGKQPKRPDDWGILYIHLKNSTKLGNRK